MEFNFDDIKALFDKIVAVIEQLIASLEEIFGSFSIEMAGYPTEAPAEETTVQELLL